MRARHRVALSRAGPRRRRSRGPQKPGLDAGGALPDLHGLVVGVFMLVGVPLFTGVVGDLAGFFFEDTLRKEDERAMNRPIKMEDFEIASQLMDPDGKIGKAEYILLELMRLGKTDVASIGAITQHFERIDVSGDGFVDKEEILRFNKAVGCSSDVESGTAT